MELLERNPLPPRCIECEKKAELYYAADEAERLRMETEEDFSLDCGSCDYALERFYIPREEELRLKKKGLEKGIERLQRQIAAIDKELQDIKG